MDRGVKRRTNGPEQRKRGREEGKDEEPLQKNLAARTKEETAGEKAKRRHRGIKMAEK